MPNQSLKILNNRIFKAFTGQENKWYADAQLKAIRYAGY